MSAANSDSTLVITRIEKVSRTGGGYKLLVDCFCTAGDLGNDGYPTDSTFPAISDLANGSSMILTDSKKVKIFDESNQEYKEW